MPVKHFQELGWDTWDTAIVWPEYRTGEDAPISPSAIRCPNTVADAVSRR